MMPAESKNQRKYALCVDYQCDISKKYFQAFFPLVEILFNF